MPIVHCTCNKCGDIDLPIEDFTIRYVRGTSTHTCGFSCKTCNTAMYIDLPHGKVEEMVLAGAKFKTIEQPQELDERLEFLEDGRSLIDERDITDFRAAFDHLMARFMEQGGVAQYERERDVPPDIKNV